MNDIKYSIESSGFYNLKSVQKLCVLLGVEKKDIKKILENKIENYKQKVDGKRKIQVPLGKYGSSNRSLYKIHERILLLFTRIELPDYLHSARKKRSYITNANAHLSAGVVCKADISSFYENTKFKHIEDFFFHQMKCSREVASLLADLITCYGHLPTGSPLSPLLSFFIHKSTFDKIYQIAKDADVTMTLFIDDLTFSGNAANEIRWEAEKLLGSIDLKINSKKTKLYQAGQSREITGMVIKNGKAILRNRTHKKIYDGFKDLLKLQKDKDGKAVESQKIILKGTLHEAANFNFSIDSFIKKLNQR